MNSNGLFGRISEIDLADTTSWQGRIFLTIDVDWAPEVIINDVLEILEESGGIPANFYCTHASAVLDEQIERGFHEFGIHPNFNPLLSGDHRYGSTYSDVVDYYMDLVPGARSVKSHSLAVSSPILDKFTRSGIEYDLNTLVPYKAGVQLKPWLHWDLKLTKIPYCWDDTVAICYKDPNGFNSYYRRDSINVVAFHPIHIYLNTEDLKRYAAIKSFYDDVPRVLSQRNKEVKGTRDKFRELLKFEG